ncbi:MAG: hypothetical protein ACTIJJ_12420 [Galactobacter sp.]|uniref:hypothetical protein n=1 Tax=Galactobacter sp. TaxID=2676125 RepID=UPI0025BA54F4|nr:hypothetical protein [Galactobacter sp.]
MAEASASPILVDISPYVVVNGEAYDLDDGVSSLSPDRVHEVLRSGRFLASVKHVPPMDEDDEVYFNLACDAQGRVLQLSATGEMVPGKTLSEVEADLATVLGCDVDLWRDDGEDEDDDAPAAPAGIDGNAATGAPADGGASGVKDVGWVDGEGHRYADRPAARQTADDADLEPHDASDLDDADEDWVPAPQRTLVFSRRGQSDGLELVWETRADAVASGVDGDWSVFRMTVPDPEDHDVAWTSRGCLPSIVVSRDADDPQGSVVAVVETRTARKDEALYIWISASVHSRAVFQPSEVSSEAQPVLALLLNAHLDPGGDTAKLLQDPQLKVDGMRLQAALAPNFPATMEQRIEEFVLACGLPTSLVHPAVRETELPGERTYTRKNVWANIKQVILDGTVNVLPRARRRRGYARWEGFLMAHPRTAVTVSGLQAVLGAGLMGTSWPGGGWRTVVVLAGGLLILDAVADALITRARQRRRE